MTLTDADSAGRALLRTPHGVLSAPDLLVSISESRPVGLPPAPAEGWTGLPPTRPA